MLDPMTALDKVKAGDGKAPEKPRRLTRAPDAPAGVLPNPKPTLAQDIEHGLMNIGRFCAGYLRKDGQK